MAKENNNKKFYTISSGITSGDRSFQGLDFSNESGKQFIKLCVGESCSKLQDAQQTDENPISGDVNVTEIS